MGFFDYFKKKAKSLFVPDPTIEFQSEPTMKSQIAQSTPMMLLQKIPIPVKPGWNKPSFGQQFPSSKSILGGLDDQSLINIGMHHSIRKLQGEKLTAEEEKEMQKGIDMSIARIDPYPFAPTKVVGQKAVQHKQGGFFKLFGDKKSATLKANNLLKETEILRGTRGMTAQDITTKLLEKLKGRSEVSKQFIQD